MISTRRITAGVVCSLLVMLAASCGSPSETAGTSTTLATDGPGVSATGPHGGATTLEPEPSTTVATTQDTIELKGRFCDQVRRLNSDEFQKSIEGDPETADPAKLLVSFQHGFQLTADAFAQLAADAPADIKTSMTALSDHLHDTNAKVQAAKSMSDITGGDFDADLSTPALEAHAHKTEAYFKKTCGVDMSK